MGMNWLGSKGTWTRAWTCAAIVAVAGCGDDESGMPAGATMSIDPSGPGGSSTSEQTSGAATGPMGVTSDEPTSGGGTSTAGANETGAASPIKFDGGVPDAPDTVFCGAPHPVSCDDQDDDPWHAIGLNCPGGPQVNGSTAGNAQQFHVHTGNIGTHMPAPFPPREGQKILIMESEQWTGNISFDEMGNPISLNAGFLDYKDAPNNYDCPDPCEAPELAGTGWKATPAPSG